MPSVCGKPICSCSTQSKANPMSTSVWWTGNSARIKSAIWTSYGTIMRMGTQTPWKTCATEPIFFSMLGSRRRDMKLSVAFCAAERGKRVEETLITNRRCAWVPPAEAQTRNVRAALLDRCWHTHQRDQQPTEDQKGLGLGTAAVLLARVEHLIYCARDACATPHGSCSCVC